MFAMAGSPQNDFSRLNEYCLLFVYTDFVVQKKIIHLIIIRKQITKNKLFNRQYKLQTFLNHVSLRRIFINSI